MPGWPGSLAQIAEAAALPVTDPAGTVQPGWVSLVLVPRSRDPRPIPSQELRRRVQDYLKARAPIGIGRWLRLVDPEYQDVAVMADVTVRDAGEASAVEARLRERLDRFLHALDGGSDGTGWPFGATLYLSGVARLLAAVPGVLSLTRLGWLRGTSLAAEVIDLPSDRLPAPGGRDQALAGRILMLLLPSLDSRTFDQLVDEARRQIPLLAPEWTGTTMPPTPASRLSSFWRG